MDAILYAAGRGSRLGAASGKPHKILLEFNGRSLLERHVMHLAALDVRRLFVVTGHERSALAAEFSTLQRRHAVEILEIFNAAFLEGSVLSLHASLPAVRQATDRVLLMDGDVLYGLEMLRRLIESPHRTALLVDRNFSKEDDDPVLVPMQKGRPFDFVKRWQGQADEVGESVGFFKVGSADFTVLIRETEARLSGAARQDSYDDVLRVLVRAGRFGAEDVTGLPWTEIDFPRDLEYACNTVLPALREETPATRAEL
jgi:choline kinase